MVRGNCPQAALGAGTTDSLVWGSAINPYDEKRSCGSSSGGDAGMVATRCVPLGIGTDIGGDIRFPGASCGIMSFKPTQTRFSRRGISEARKEKWSQFNYLV